jgi:hypothetical protein
LVIGVGVMLTAFLAAFLLRLIGPRLTHEGSSIGLDEREAMVRARAIAASSSLLALGLICACFYASAAQLLDWWMPRNQSDWLFLGFTLLTWWLLLPSWLASWMLPAPQSDEA